MGNVNYTEPRDTSSTGGQRGGTTKPRMSLIPPKARAEVAKVGMLGAAKYGEHNYLKGMPLSWHLDAIDRHSAALAAGEIMDPESKVCHFAHIAFDAMMALECILREIPEDDLSIRATFRGKQS